MASQAIDFSMPSTSAARPPNSGPIRFSTQEKGKARDTSYHVDSDSISEEEDDDQSSSGEHTELEGPGSSHHVATGSDWDLRDVAKLKAIARSELEPILLPALNTSFTSGNTFRVLIAAYAIQNNFSTNAYRQSSNFNGGTKLVAMRCARAHSRVKDPCEWLISATKLHRLPFKIDKVHLLHNHLLHGEQQRAVNDSSRYSDRSRKRKSESSHDRSQKKNSEIISNNLGQPGFTIKAERGTISFPSTREIITGAYHLIKNSPRPIVQNMELSFSSATEMRVHMTAVAITNEFALNCLIERGQGFKLRCMIGTGPGSSCSFRFHSIYKGQAWIVNVLEPAHSHEMGIYEMVGHQSRKTAKGLRLQRDREENGNGNLSFQEEEAVSTEEEEQQSVSTRATTTSNQNERKRKKEERRKKSRPDPVPPPLPRRVQDHNPEPAAPALPPQLPPALPAPIAATISSPEWINSLTKLLTAIDSRLSNLAPLLASTGIEDKIAVMEMMHLSEIGLERLGQSIMESGSGINGMTAMQKILFKKGVVKVREGMK